MKKRVWIVSELFYPDETSTAYILTKVAEKLTSEYNVNVICGPSSYSNDKFENKRNLNDNINIFRVSETTLDKNNLLTRLLRFIMLSIKLSSTLWKKVSRGENVLIVTNPAPMLLIMPVLKKFKKFSLTILVHDVFPENTIPAHIISSNKSILFRILKKIFDSAYRKADKLVVLGRDMEKIMKDKLGDNKNHTRIEIIENWAQTKIIRPGTKSVDLMSNPKIDIQYAGNVGRVQGLSQFVELFYEAKNPDIRLSIWGDGAIKKDLEKYVYDNAINNIIFGGQYSRNDQNIVLNNCDLAIVTLADGMYGLGVPSKSYNIMAAGKPILFIGDLNSEIALTVKEFDIGYCFCPRDVQGIKLFLSSLSESSRKELAIKGAKARNIAESYFAEDIILHKFLSVFN